jgi:hypothetical protein
LVGKPAREKPVGKPMLYSKIIFKQILKIRVERYGLDSHCSGHGPVAKSNKDGNKLSISIKGAKPCRSEGQ